MLLPSEHLIGTPVMSLQTGLELARTSGVIIDPRQLVVVAFTLRGPRLDNPNAVLHPDDIREIGTLGFIVNDSDALMDTNDLVRLKEIIEFHFGLVGLKVVDENHRKLGKVSSYTIDPETFSIQQLYTKQTGLRSLNTVGAIVHRSQIISITNEQIVVSSPTIREGVAEKAEEVASAFVNPFRGTQEGV